MNFLFFLRNFTDRRTTHDFFFFPLSQDCSPFHLKEALYSFSLADQNCQNHFSCVLGPRLSKIELLNSSTGVPWQSIWLWRWLLMSGMCWTKRWFPSRVGPSRTLWDLTTSLRFACGASVVAQMVRNPPATRETWVQLLGWEDRLEKGMVTHSRILRWRIPWTEGPGGLQSMGSQSDGHNWVANTN